MGLTFSEFSLVDEERHSFLSRLDNKTEESSTELETYAVPVILGICFLIGE